MRVTNALSGVVTVWMTQPDLEEILLSLASSDGEDVQVEFEEELGTRTIVFMVDAS